jgi:hypothetical protein
MIQVLQEATLLLLLILPPEKDPNCNPQTQKRPRHHCRATINHDLNGTKNMFRDQACLGFGIFEKVTQAFRFTRRFESTGNPPIEFFFRFSTSRYDINSL